MKGEVTQMKAKWPKKPVPRADIVAESYGGIFEVSDLRIGEICSLTA